MELIMLYTTAHILYLFSISSISCRRPAARAVISTSGGCGLLPQFHNYSILCCLLCLLVADSRTQYSSTLTRVMIVQSWCMYKMIVIITSKYGRFYFTSFHNPQKTIHIACTTIHEYFLIVLCEMITTWIFHNPQIDVLNLCLVKWYPRSLSEHNFTCELVYTHLWISLMCGVLPWSSPGL